MNSARENVEAFDRQVEHLRKRRGEYIQLSQEACPHPLCEIVEGRYKTAGLVFGAQAPFRVCRLCGYAEEGWYCGYWKLNSERDPAHPAGNHIPIPELPRDAAMKYVLRRLSQEEISALRWPKGEKDCA